MPAFLTLFVLSIFLSGCVSVSPFHSYSDEDETGRFYKTTEGDVLRVDPNGIVRAFMVADGEYLLRPPRIIGRTTKVMAQGTRPRRHGLTEFDRLQELVQMPEFQALDQDAQIIVLQKRIPGFKDLDQPTQVEVLKQVRGIAAGQVETIAPVMTEQVQEEEELWDWDMSQYQVVEPTGSCKDIYTKEPGVSCWNLVWEIPSLIVYGPAWVLVTAVKLRFGLDDTWSREVAKVVFDAQTCGIQTCSEDEKGFIQLRWARLSGTGMSSARTQPQPGFIPTPRGGALLGPITPDAYGPGLNSDATGRPFMWEPQFGGSGFPDPTLRVQPNVHGPGIGMDQYGRPVRPSCLPGMMC